MTSQTNNTRRFGLADVDQDHLFNYNLNNLDIILIHGANDDQSDCYTHARTGFFWPGHFLQSKKGKSRILTWKWDPSIIRRTSMGTTGTLDDLARGLLADIAGYGHKLGSRPLVFVAKDVGGNIVEAAITEAFDHKDYHYTDIAHNIRALMFLGTPHRGSEGIQTSRRLWHRLGTMSNILVNEDLNPGSDYLKRISIQVRNLIKEHHIRVCSCWATKLKVKWGVRYIVKEGSASLYCEGERCIPLGVDHAGLMKFSDENDVTYLRLMSIWDGWISDLGKVSVCELEAASAPSTTPNSTGFGQELPCSDDLREVGSNSRDGVFTRQRHPVDSGSEATQLLDSLSSGIPELHGSDVGSFVTELPVRSLSLLSFEKTGIPEPRSAPPMLEAPHQFFKNAGGDAPRLDTSWRSSQSWSNASTVVGVLTASDEGKVFPRYTGPRVPVKVFTPQMGWLSMDSLLDLDTQENLICLEHATELGFVAPLEPVRYIEIRFRIGRHMREERRWFQVVPHLRESLVLATLDSWSAGCDDGHGLSPSSTWPLSTPIGGSAPITPHPHSVSCHHPPHAGTTRTENSTQTQLLTVPLPGPQCPESFRSECWQPYDPRRYLRPPTIDQQPLDVSTGNHSSRLLTPTLPNSKRALSDSCAVVRGLSNSVAPSGSNQSSNGLQIGLAAGSLGVSAGSSVFNAYTAQKQYQLNKSIHEHTQRKDGRDVVYRRQNDETNRALEQEKFEYQKSRDTRNSRGPPGHGGTGNQPCQPERKPRLTIVTPSILDTAVQMIPEMPSVPLESPRLRSPSSGSPSWDGRTSQQGDRRALAILADGDNLDDGIECSPLRAASSSNRDTYEEAAQVKTPPPSSPPILVVPGIPMYASPSERGSRGQNTGTNTFTTSTPSSYRASSGQAPQTPVTGKSTLPSEVDAENVMTLRELTKGYYSNSSLRIEFGTSGASRVEVGIESPAEAMEMQDLAMVGSWTGKGKLEEHDHLSFDPNAEDDMEEAIDMGEFANDEESTTEGEQDVEKSLQEFPESCEAVEAQRL